jgi:hypothetical protein
MSCPLSVTLVGTFNGSRKFSVTGVDSAFLGSCGMVRQPICVDLITGNVELFSKNVALTILPNRNFESSGKR